MSGMVMEGWVEGRGRDDTHLRDDVLVQLVLE